MPTKIPNLLVNGASGIAVGMATNIPPHNLTEVINGCLAYVDDEDISIEGLMAHIPGPDFPTAAIINGRRGIEEAYRTGRGKCTSARAEVEVDAKSGRETIIVHEIPYQVNKARLIEKIAELVKEKRVEGISALRDESDKDGMRIVIEVKRDAVGGSGAQQPLFPDPAAGLLRHQHGCSAPWSAEDHEPEGHHRRVCTPPP